MNNINNFNDVIEYIENNLTENIDIAAIARKAKMSIYEFRRVFSFAAGIPISEYIRKRRLSAAGAELAKNSASITEIAIKYGYDSSSSFSRAFKEFHGFSPNETYKNHIKMFTKIGFEFCVTGGENITYKIVSAPDFYICGITGNSDIYDTVCCEIVWNKYYASETAKASDKKIYAAYVNDNGCVKCTIGEKTFFSENNYIHIPKSNWVCFPMHTSDTAAVNKFYTNIIYNWFGSVNYSRNNAIPNIEVFPPDTQPNSSEWEIYIPIK